MGYGTGLRLFSGLGVRTTRRSVNSTYNSASYRKSTSSFTSVSNSSLAGFGKKGGERSFIITDPMGNTAIGAIGGSNQTTSSASGGGISNVVGDVTPQLGGLLDINGKGLVNNSTKYGGGVRIGNLVLPSEIPYDGAVLTVTSSPLGTGALTETIPTYACSKKEHSTESACVAAGGTWNTINLGNNDVAPGDASTRQLPKVAVIPQLARNSCKFTARFFSPALGQVVTGPDPAGGPSEEVLSERYLRQYWDENGFWSVTVPYPCSFYNVEFNEEPNSQYWAWFESFANSGYWNEVTGNGVYENMLFALGGWGYHWGFSGLLMMTGVNNTNVNHCHLQDPGSYLDDPQAAADGNDDLSNNMPYPYGGENTARCIAIESVPGTGYETRSYEQAADEDKLIYTNWVHSDAVGGTTQDRSGGIDYATFEVNASGELTVSYLGGDYDNAFTINNNGELEVTI